MGFMEDQYDSSKKYIGTVFNDYSYNSWGKEGGVFYDNMGTFFDNGLIVDESISISGGTKQGSYYLSGSLFDQNGIVPTTGYSKYTFRFNGDQKVGIFTFSASAAYSKAHTDKTLTGAGLYGSAGTGALYALYTWAPSDNMSRYLNEDGTRFRHFADRQDPWDDRDNPTGFSTNSTFLMIPTVSPATST